jgi:hypothetical protein
MRKVFVAAGALLLLAVVAQFYLAGVGAFHRPFDNDAFLAHGINAGVVQGASLLAALAAGLAGAGRRTVLLALLPFLLVFVQYGIFALTDLFLPAGTPRGDGGVPAVVEGTPNYVIALHVVNGLAILWVAVVVFLRARRLAAAPQAQEESREPVAEPLP